MSRKVTALSVVGSLALGWAGCNAILGIEPIQETLATDAGDGGGDASNDAALPDSLLPEAAPDTPLLDAEVPDADAAGDGDATPPDAAGEDTALDDGATDTAGEAAITDAGTDGATDVAAEAGVAPVVTATTPLDLAVGTGIHAKPTVTFSKPMDPLTITPLTFIVKQGTTSVLGKTSLDGVTNTARFAPDVPFGLGLPYTAVITTGARDASGLALLGSHTWSFTTATCGQLPVALGSASGFVVLAASTITSTGATSLTGDLGVSPGTAVTGFPPGTSTGSFEAGSAAAATAMFDFGAAYAEVKGRTSCAVTLAGDLSGRTLAPGLYRSVTSMAITTADLTLDAQGDGEAVFVFQMATTLGVTAGRRLVLTNGAKAGNVFWQVGTSATLATMSVFEGTILADQSITLDTGATLSGRAFARVAAVTLVANTIVLPTP